MCLKIQLALLFALYFCIFCDVSCANAIEPVNFKKTKLRQENAPFGLRDADRETVRDIYGKLDLRPAKGTQHFTEPNRLKNWNVGVYSRNK